MSTLTEILYHGFTLICAAARRALPLWRNQMWTFFKRFLVQYRRSGRAQLLDLTMVAFGGACLGGTYKAIALERYPSMATMSGLVVGNAFINLVFVFVK